MNRSEAKPKGLRPQFPGITKQPVEYFSTGCFSVTLPASPRFLLSAQLRKFSLRFAPGIRRKAERAVQVDFHVTPDKFDFVHLGHSFHWGAVPLCSKDSISQLKSNKPAYLSGAQKRLPPMGEAFQIRMTGTLWAVAQPASRLWQENSRICR